MLNQANRLERLITDLLEAARIESGKPLVENQSVELVALLAEQVHEFSEQAPDRSIQLKAEAPRVLVRGDPFRLTQVVSNLIANAIKYSPAATPVIVSVEPAHGHAVVSVQDFGEGIPLPEQERIFERFHRVNSGPTRQTGGTGLGLFIAKRLVEAMNGRLWVQSVPGAGSTFSFSVLLTDADQSPSLALTPAAQSARNGR
jgi:signal transduction histidine kinase